MQAVKRECPLAYNVIVIIFSRTLCGDRYTFCERYDADSAQYCRDKCSDACNEALGISNSEPVGSIGNHFHQPARNAMSNRKFFITQKGRFDLVPQLLKKGDVCCVLFGANAPFIIRTNGPKSHYKLLGECLVLGVMEGEVVESRREGLLEQEEIVLT